MTKSAANVYLCGMIGTGKTMLGERLAARLGRPFHDLDREMDRELGRSFHELVSEQGWLAFREVEWNADVLRGTGVTVLLEGDLALLADRVRAADRPRVHGGLSLEEDLARIWSQSAPLYRRAADLVYRIELLER